MNMTAGILISIIIGFGITAALGFIVVPWLRKLKFGQTILDIGPSWHKSKQGTPNMGGIMFGAGIIISFAVAAVIYVSFGGSLESENYSSVITGRENVLCIAGVFLALACGIIGFIDDFIKVKLKRNEGLSAKQKSLFQLAVSFCYILTLWLSHNTSWYFPFLGTINFEKNIVTSVIFWLLSLFIIYGCVNAVNLTDGIDGLCSSVTGVSAAAGIAIAVITGFAGLSFVSGALFGAMIGFLCWNKKPAKVFMGDTGSLFLGGMVVAIGYMIKCPVLLLLIGIVYVLETLSDIIQIGYFKLTHGKRVFKMAPIHHHFEMSGWSEQKICAVFSAVQVIGCAAAVLLIYFGFEKI
ncbi:MAG: phospho-N-acetylmuramoyl-pentapeptide-transferase [Clostridiales bacterium]|nr:phospho-N-acetylmuramoyl-pentapeptide-transferase [Clostridiales bacterium]